MKNNSFDFIEIHKQKPLQKEIKFTKSQTDAVNGLLDFLNSEYNNKKFIYGLIGAGGVGKTFVIKYIIERCNYATSVIRCTAPTHKACRVFEQALDNNSLKTYTIQSIFGFRLNTKIEDFDPNNPAFSPVSSPKLDNIKVLIIDEASMLNANLVNYIIKICSNLNIKILFIGDDFQLAPVKENKSTAFTKCTIVYELTEIVRQNYTNPINNILQLLRQDIKHHTHKTIDFISKNINNDVYNEIGEGYSIIGANGFKHYIAQKFNDKDYTKNINLYKIIAYTNNAVNRYNFFIRNEIIKDAEKNIITKNDLLMSYETIVDEFNSPIISNSEEYIVKDLVNYTDVKYGFKGFLIKFQLVNGGTITKPLFVLDHKDAFTIQMYVKEIEQLLNSAKTANMANRSRKWSEYFAFKSKYLLATNIKRGTQIIYQRDIDYAFALTSHKSQGSTYENVFIDLNDMLYDSYGKLYNNYDDILRRIYVACSRAKKQLIICYGY